MGRMLAVGVVVTVGFTAAVGAECAVVSGIPARETEQSTEQYLAMSHKSAMTFNTKITVQHYGDFKQELHLMYICK